MPRTVARYAAYRGNSTRPSSSWAWQVALGEDTGEIAAAMKGEVHVSEGHVRHGIDAAEAFVELDAVDDDQIRESAALGEIIDVIQMQVAVTVARHAALGSGIDQGAETIEGLLGQRLHPGEHRCVHGRAELGSGFCEYVQNKAGDLFPPAERGDVRIRRVPRKRRDLAGPADRPNRRRLCPV